MANENIIGETVGEMLPTIGVANTAKYIGIGLGVIVLIGILGFGVWWFLNRMKYNKTIVLFRKVGNKSVPIGTDKGMFERVGDAGDYWLITKKFKKTLPKPQKQMGKNEYWFYEREDGEWINFDLKDIDQQMKDAGIDYVEEDMRLQRLGIQKNLRDRFYKESFWQKYGNTIMSVMFILIISIMLIVLFKEMKENWTVGKEMAEAVRDMALQVQNIRVRSTSGAMPVDAFVPFIIPFAFWRKGFWRR